ncbi:MAG: amidohydrolase family protein [Azospirillaceae bacterium]
MADLLLRHAAHVWTGASPGRLDDAWIRVEGGRIAALGPEPCPPEHAGAEGVETIDLTGHLVTPGFVNTHHHFFQSVTRGIPGVAACGYMDWLAGLYPMWARMTAEDFATATRVAVGELLLSGVTTTADFAYLLPETDDARLDALLDVAREAGIRLHLVRGCMPRIEGDLAQRLAPVMGEAVLADLLDTPERLVAGMERAATRHDTDPFAMLRVAFGPTSVTYDDPALLARIGEIAHAAGCGLHTHYHPREDERALTDRLHGKPPVRVLADAGWLAPGTWFAHCTRLDDEDIAAFADNGCGVAHCPRCCLRLGLPVAPIGRLREKDVALGIGVDGSASNDSGNFLGELRLALVLHRVAGRDRADPVEHWMTADEVLRLATSGGARVLGRDRIGTLAPGMAADIAAFDLRRIGYAGSADPVEGFLLAGSHPYADLTVVAGRVRVRDGRLLDVDERALVAEANRVAARLATADGDPGRRP